MVVDAKHVSRTTFGPGRSFLIRCGWIYLLLWAFPFPLSTFIFVLGALFGQLGALFGMSMPMLGNIVQIVDGAYDQLLSLITVPVGALFGVPVLVQPTGSGDTAHAFIKAGLFLFFAIVVAGCWQWRARARSPERVARWAHVWGRWWLATCLMRYGFIKLFALQFWGGNPHDFAGTLGDMSPMHLAWTFFGHSDAYQRFSGLAELIPSILILHRKTAMMGLLILAGVMTNVFALNCCFDIPVKLGSGHYLLASLLLLTPYVPRLRALVAGRSELPVVDLCLCPTKISPRRWAQFTKVAGVALVLSMFAESNLQAQQMQAMRTPSPHAGLWKIREIQRDGMPLADASGYIYLAIDDLGRLSLIDAQGEKTTFKIEPSSTPEKLELAYPWKKPREGERSKHTWSVTRGDAQSTMANHWPTNFRDRKDRIEVMAPTIKLAGSWQGHSYEISAIRPPLPIEQGFRWIQEAPFQH